MKEFKEAKIEIILLDEEGREIMTDVISSSFITDEDELFSLRDQSQLLS